MASAHNAPGTYLICPAAYRKAGPVAPAYPGHAATAATAVQPRRQHEIALLGLSTPSPNPLGDGRLRRRRSGGLGVGAPGLAFVVLSKAIRPASDRGIAMVAWCSTHRNEGHWCREQDS